MLLASVAPNYQGCCSISWHHQSNQQGEKERERERDWKVERKWEWKTRKIGKQTVYGDLIVSDCSWLYQLNTVQTFYTLHQSTTQLSPPHLVLSTVLIVVSHIKVYLGNFPKSLPSETLQAKNVVLTVCSSKWLVKSIVICCRGLVAEGADMLSCEW